MKKLLLLPSAKLVPSELRVDFGEIPSGMVPLNSRPALHYIIEPHANNGADVVVAVHEQGAMIAEYLEHHPELRARAVEVGCTRHLGETVLKALEEIGTLPDSLSINFADTLITAGVPEGNVAIYADAEDDGYRWTTFDLDEERGRIVALLDKGRQKPVGSPGRVFVGSFSFAAPARLMQCLESALNHPDPEIDPFYTAVADYFNATADDQKCFYRTADWLDFGHLDTYYATKRKIFLNARYFNTLTVDSERGIIRKQSRDEAKLTTEVQWYRSLPPGLEYLAPRVFDFSSMPGNTFAELEFYGYPALNDVYVYGQWDAGVWTGVLRAIDHALNMMQSEPEPRLTTAGRLAAMRQMYESKTAERLARVLEDKRFEVFVNSTVDINGKRCAGLGRVMDHLPGVLTKAGVYEDEPFTVIHGDLCLSNILYDRRNGFVRLIDPRGSFGVAGIYGDPRYDLAKLSHSLEGDYDLLLNGLFELETAGGAVWVRPRLNAFQKSLKPVFHRWLESRCGGWYPAVKAIEGLLFLSMVPLHADRVKAQMAFLARGLELLQDAMDRSNETSQAGSHNDHFAEYCYHDGR